MLLNGGMVCYQIGTRAMPRGTKGETRPADVIGNAFEVSTKVALTRGLC
jgi:hypothetical protein